MLAQPQFSSPDVCGPRGGGLQGLREGLVPRGPAELFGLGEARSPEVQSPSSPQSPPWRPPAPPQQGPAPQTQGSWAARADYALSNPTVVGRVAELTPILPQVPTKELHVIFQTIVEKVFGLQSGGRGWNVCSTLRTQHPREYTALASFLGTNGPLLAAAHRLLAEPYLRYDFPVGHLPAATQREVEAGAYSHPILAGRLSPGRGHLSLNSFEYYMFTWAAYIVQPYGQDNKLVAGESLYPYVLEDYLSYFLPCDGTTPPRLPFQLSHSPRPSSPHQEPAPSPPTSTPARKSLLRHPSSFLASPRGHTSISSPSSTPRQNIQSHNNLPAQDQTWRSETLLNIFSLVWLSQFEATAQSSAPVPVQDTLKIIRMLIKHLHYFSNSGGPADITPLDQLKRAVLPCIRPRLFVMFRFIFSHWPHDSSFRLVLETWLSYIQPWRYTDRGRPQADTDLSQVDSRWQLFVAENLLLFSSILRLLLPRFHRMDLTSAKNAYMLFRAAKVFSQSGLTSLLQGAEAGLDRREQVTPRGGLPSSLLCTASLPVDETVLAAARQSMLELEGPGHKYHPVFGTEFRQSVCELLANAERAKEAAREGLTELTAGQSPPGEVQGQGWWRWVKQQLGEQGGGPPESAEAEELRRTGQHLTAAIGALAEVFSVALPGDSSASPGTRGRLVSAGGAERVETEAGLVLTPHGRWQLVQGIAKGTVRYEGDPDLSPITHSEVVFLVRMLHQASLWVSERWGDHLQETYSGRGLLAAAARQVLAPPCSFVTVEKSVSGGPAARTLTGHRARLNLRPLASKKVLLWLAMYYGLFKLFGYSLPYSSFLLLLLLGSYLLLLSLAKMITGEELAAKRSLLDTSDIQEEDGKKTN